MTSTEFDRTGDYHHALSAEEYWTHLCHVLAAVPVGSTRFNILEMRPAIHT